MTDPQQQLDDMRRESRAFYDTKTGKAQLEWLDAFEANLISQAITVPDPVMKADYLNQAKGLRAFKAYLDTLNRPTVEEAQARD